MSELEGARIHITGIVQGVGFRPFVYGLAGRFGLKGWVQNTSAGVDIEIDGSPDTIQSFTLALTEQAPSLAQIDSLDVQIQSPQGFSDFEIVHSQPIPNAFQPISPDVSICPDCLRELFDPQDRRYRYPFINCTNCGPRFTIIQDIPYDRPNTTMASFPLCPDCAAEYANPLDRRFHAQPVACPVCGPHIWIEEGDQRLESDQRPAISDQDPRPDRLSLIANRSDNEDVLLTAQKLLAQGKILAIKGLGGFHLACDATNPQAVAILRERKLRVDKPFALMMPDMETIRSHCRVSSTEQQLLESNNRPIVILRRRPESNIASQVAPQQDTLGVMLPYTPLHYLLFAQVPDQPDQEPPSVLVMTSGNLSEEPIAIDNEEARERLSSLADAFLMHNRPIRTRCDDSVVRIPFEKEQGSEKKAPLLMLRRSRGYAPMPVQLPWDLPPLLAAGAELKNTFCLTRERYAFLSHHVGDLENYETLRSYEDSVSHFERLFRIQPQALAYDLHPNYLATRYVLERAGRENLPAVGVQHHYAHIVACMAENGLPDGEPVIGVSFDGTGYGEDGAIWGGEFLAAGYHGLDGASSMGYRRAAHLAYVPLPGGDAAVRKPARTALAQLWHAGLDWDPELPSVAVFCAEERLALRSQLEHRLNAPLTSSMGRLFDAVAALIGIRQKVNYEAQAAIEMEMMADPEETGSYPFDVHFLDETDLLLIDPAPLVKSAAAEYLSGVPQEIIAARFHNGVAGMVLDVCQAISSKTGIRKVALSGGVWQNVTLLRKTLHLFEASPFQVYIHRQVPPNDGGLALGQAVAAYFQLYH